MGISAHETLDLTFVHGQRIAGHHPLGSAKGESWMEGDATFRRAEGKVMLHAVALEALYGSVIRKQRHLDSKCAVRKPDALAGVFGHTKPLAGPLVLGVGDFKYG